MLLTILTTISTGKELTAFELSRAVGRLSAFLAVVMIAGLFIIPRLIRAVVRLDRAETTVVASVGIAFGFALLASTFGYSVALGAFLAGALVAESGVEKTVEHLVQPVRDIFGAIFFVSVGMLIDPAQIVTHWLVVVVFLLAVVFGKILSVSIAAFFTGQGVQNSIRSGMSLAQIGEFSFIIAAVGLATGATDRLLYSMAVAVSAITTLITPWLIRFSPAVAAWVDRKLPRALQTFGALYASWLEQLRKSQADDGRAKVRGAFRWLVVDAAIVAAIVVGASVEKEVVIAKLKQHLELSDRAMAGLVILGAFILALPFVIGLVRVARYLGFELAGRVFPATGNQQLDLAAAPRRLFVVMLQLAIVLAVGLPLVAITQPFLPPFRGALLLVGVLAVLAIGFWRNATNLQGHARAGAQIVAEALVRQTQKAQPADDSHSLDDLSQILSGLGSPIAVELKRENPNIGKTLAELKLRGLTGATVLAIQRGDRSIAIPTGHERLVAGDVLAVTGTHDAVAAAIELLRSDSKK